MFCIFLSSNDFSCVQAKACFPGKVKTPSEAESENMQEKQQGPLEVYQQQTRKWARCHMGMGTL